jgi:signal transduction histidine kinase
MAKIKSGRAFWLASAAAGLIGLAVIAPVEDVTAKSTAAPSVAAAPPGFRRLNEAQYIRSVEQIFGNLIDNAVKYLDAGRPGRIVVTGEAAPGGWIVYRIADNGRGISDRDHERIFELFRRAGRQDRPGEGLGLAFVRNSVRRLGGDISVESELGKGSTFILKFPTRLILPDAGEYP